MLYDLIHSDNKSLPTETKEDRNMLYEEERNNEAPQEQDTTTKEQLSQEVAALKQELSQQKTASEEQIEQLSQEVVVLKKQIVQLRNFTEKHVDKKKIKKIEEFNTKQQKGKGKGGTDKTDGAGGIDDDDLLYKSEESSEKESEYSSEMSGNEESLALDQNDQGTQMQSAADQEDGKPTIEVRQNIASKKRTKLAEVKKDKSHDAKNQKHKVSRKQVPQRVQMQQIDLHESASDKAESTTEAGKDCTIAEVSSTQLEAEQNTTDINLGTADKTQEPQVESTPSSKQDIGTKSKVKIESTENKEATSKSSVSSRSKQQATRRKQAKTTEGNVVRDDKKLYTPTKEKKIDGQYKNVLPRIDNGQNKGDSSTQISGTLSQTSSSSVGTKPTHTK